MTVTFSDRRVAHTVETRTGNVHICVATLTAPGLIEGTRPVVILRVDGDAEQVLTPGDIRRMRDALWDARENVVAELRQLGQGYEP